MRKHLIVSQTEDIKLFKPIEFDKIFVVFSEDNGVPSVENMDVQRSGYNEDKSKEKEYKDCFDIVLGKMKKLVAPDVDFWTYNPYGDNFHPDNILVHQAVKEIADRFGLSVYYRDDIV